MSNWNPRYTAYARTFSFSEEQMLEYDKIKWPGGCMAGFMLWVQERWMEWKFNTYKTKDIYFILSEEDHKNFDKWLINL